MDYLLRHLPDIVVVVLTVSAQFGLARKVIPFRRFGTHGRLLSRFFVSLSVPWILFGFLFGIPSMNQLLPGAAWIEWLRSSAIAWAIVSSGMFAVYLALSRVPSRPSFSPERRKLIHWARAAAVAAPAAVFGYGFWFERRQFHLKDIEVPIPGLPADLDGLRLVQITDIHFGPYLDRRALEHIVNMANETRAHLALVTGDLITARDDSLVDCLDVLRGLRADAGVLGCLGNHEIFARCEDEATDRASRFGLRFLRNQSAAFRFGSATMNVAGVDYQRMNRPYLTGAERLVQHGAFNLLLSHNPDVYPVAAAKGFDLTVSGHTHGGQVNVEILHQNWNVARFFTPYVYGLYNDHGRFAWVSRGLGTVGVPARVGAPPEVALIRLCAI